MVSQLGKYLKFKHIRRGGGGGGGGTKMTYSMQNNPLKCYKFLTFIHLWHYRGQCKTKRINITMFKNWNISFLGACGGRDSSFILVNHTFK